jgi:hypothetical protein
MVDQIFDAHVELALKMGEKLGGFTGGRGKKQPARYLSQGCAARDLKWKAREGKLQLWPSQNVGGFITMSLS